MEKETRHDLNVLKIFLIKPSKWTTYKINERRWSGTQIGSGTYQDQKILPNCEGPYRICEKLSHIAYKLEELNDNLYLNYVN